MKRWLPILRGWLDRPAAFPLVLLGVTLAAYMFQVLAPGFYWDDWQVVYLAHYHDPQVYWNYYLSDRPFSVWIYLLSVPFLGQNPLLWQLFAIGLRLGGALAVYAALAAMWPSRERMLRWVAILLVVYPGFSQQAISVAYSQHFLTFGLFAVSVLLMIHAVQDRNLRLPFTLAGAGLALVQLMSMEYYAGLELLRPLIIAYTLAKTWNGQGQPERRGWGQVPQILTHWAPYAAVLVGFTFYRLVLFPNMAPGEDSNDPYMLGEFLRQPVASLTTLMQKGLQDFFHAGLFVWVRPLDPKTINLTTRIYALAWLVGIVVAVLVGLYQNRAVGRQPQPVEDTPPREVFETRFLLLGLLAFVLGMLPVLLTDRQIIVGKWSDRFTLAPMMGAVMLVVGLADWVAYSPRRRNALLAVFLNLSLVFQIQNSYRYALEWSEQRYYYWQLVWRAPDLPPGVAVAASEIPFGTVADYSIGFALNLIYGMPQDPFAPQTWYINTSRHLGSEIYPANEPGLPIHYSIRHLDFKGNTAELLAVSWPEGAGCLRVLDDVYRDQPPYHEQDAPMWAVVDPKVSLPADDAPGSLPRHIFGAEPEHGWCYYFQKADLARQMQDWQQVKELDSQARDAGFQPAVWVEMAPFIEAYARLGEWDTAVEYTRAVAEVSPETVPVLCELWGLLKEETPPEGRGEWVDQMEAELNCSEN